MSNPRELAMAAAAASIAAAYPLRVVKRGLVDPAHIGDEALNQGVICLIAEGRGGFNRNRGAEGNSSTLRAACVVYLRVADEATPEQLEQAEAAAEQDILAWCATAKAEPIDAVYPESTVYSRGLEHPVGWVLVNLEILYV